MFRQIPIRLRLTAGFAAAMAVIIVAFGAILYAAMADVLLDEIDTGLRFRAATVAAELPGQPRLGPAAPGLIEHREAFAQVLGPDGIVLGASQGLAGPLMDAARVRAIRSQVFSYENVPGVEAGARLFTLPVIRNGRRYLVIVGSSLSDRADALRMIERFFLLCGPLALAIACSVGWILAGTGLRPVDRMRRQAAAISAAGAGRRLSVPPADDEVGRLARTLNGMLGRIDDAALAERRFLDNASHELRTPLTALKAELDLARSRPRTAADLAAVVDSASEETDRLVRMADDLLVLARAGQGRLGVQPEETPVRELLDASAAMFARRAAAAAITIEVTAPEATAWLDRARIRQAVDNLIDNALRYAQTTITMQAVADNGTVTIAVSDDGPGLPPGSRQHEADVGAFAAFERSASSEADGRPDESGGAGLGLAIVRMITEGHGGQVSAANRPAGGLTVQLILPDGRHPSQPTADTRPATCQRADAAHRGRRQFRYDSPRGDNR
jgi:two-component system, OmpR family, sensor kinase